MFGAVVQCRDGMRVLRDWIARGACLIVGAGGVLLGACGEQGAKHSERGPQHDDPHEVTLHVMAAASLEGAFREIADAFERSQNLGAVHDAPGTNGPATDGRDHGDSRVVHTPRKVVISLSLAGSQHLVTQLEHGAPADVLALAGWKPMDRAQSAKLVDETTVGVFAHNTLAILVPKANPAKVTGLGDLSRPGVSIVVAEKAVPLGAYTRELLVAARTNENYGPAFVEAMESNIVSYEQSVSGVVSKIALGEADAGIAYSSDASGGNAARITVLPLPPGLAPRADYPIAVTTSASESSLARVFVEFLNTDEARRILTEHGFELQDTSDPSEEP